MDPASAFALACGIVQLVDTGISAAKLCHQIHENESSLPLHHQRIEYEAESLRNATASLTAHFHDLKLVDNKLSPNQARLNEAARECDTIAQELLGELSRLKLGKKRKRDIPTQLWNTHVKKQDIDILKRKLQHCQSVLDTQMLNQLLYVCLVQSFPFNNLIRRTQQRCGSPPNKA